MGRDAEKSGARWQRTIRAATDQTKSHCSNRSVFQPRSKTRTTSTRTRPPWETCAAPTRSRTSSRRQAQRRLPRPQPPRPLPPPLSPSPLRLPLLPPHPHPSLLQTHPHPIQICPLPSRLRSPSSTSVHSSSSSSRAGSSVRSESPSAGGQRHSQRFVCMLAVMCPLALPPVRSYPSSSSTPSMGTCTYTRSTDAEQQQQAAQRPEFR